MALTKRRPVAIRRYLPARELAARATSKHGNPADHSVVCAIDVAGAAQFTAAHVYAQAFVLDQRSHTDELFVVISADVPPVAVIVEVATDGEAMLDRGGFALAFMPRDVLAVCPRFEGRVRVDHVEGARCRIVAQGRYTATPLVDPQEDVRARATADAALRQIVALLIAGLPTA